MKVYKLTDEKFQTYGRTQWGEGVEHTASGEGPLCGPGWLHAYEDPRIAVLMNPIHGGFKDPVLWEADGDVGIRDRQLKLGCTRLKTIRQMELPKVTVEQMVQFAIECAKQVCYDKTWNEWADKWLSGEDRSNKVAEWAAEWAEARAAWAAEMAAWTAACAVAWTVAKAAAKAAEWSVECAVARAACAACTVARTAAEDKTFNIYAAIEKAGLV